MPIASLRITDFRNLASVSFSPCIDGLNIISGKNGSGKTSLLEAIYYLSVGRSFRSSSATRLVRAETQKFSIFSQLVSEACGLLPVGVERDINSSTRLRIAEKDAATVAEIASHLPLRVISSQSHHLFESGPIYRRQFLDWGLFYHSEPFLLAWRHYERALKQRNALLRNRCSRKECDVWTEELVKYGCQLDQFRRDYVAALTPILDEILPVLLPALSSIEIQYESGWEAGLDYATALQDAYYEELRLGYTHSGPHRADLTMTIEGLPVKHFLSRGQQKLLICAMILAQGRLLASARNTKLIYLIDDLPSELDESAVQQLITLLAQQQTQIFVTAIDSAPLCAFVRRTLTVPMSVFHVEQGKVSDGSAIETVEPELSAE